jgi:hypothetical protein
VADFVAYAYTCGCVERDRRGGPLEQDCGNPLTCYRRNRPANLVVLNRDQRRRARRSK